MLVKVLEIKDFYESARCSNTIVSTWIDTVDISTNMVNPKTGDYDDLLHIGPGNIESFTGRILDNVNTVKNDNLISGKFHFNPNDIIYGKINPQLANNFFTPVKCSASF
ncbi:hypothetical protein [Lactococcus formosensis]|uniref:hypothetical protein n=1 Tax=Lactococcus formosensis TaxID=1281486 RepID=UPI002435A04C|nr:hypothetical protein [Lactococcus formosensis]MDG6122971.1 hypothetical protein [Lactococcus formosensis]